MELKTRRYSCAGHFPEAKDARKVFSFNPGWRKRLGEAPGAQAAKYDDSDWEIVHLPDSVRLEPENASGGRN